MTRQELAKLIEDFIEEDCPTLGYFDRNQSIDAMIEEGPYRVLLQFARFLRNN